MTIHTKHDPGMFSWTDLATTDPAGAKRFYGALFGWTTVDLPVGNGAVYAMCKLGGRDAAAITTRANVPPHWTCHFTVTDVDASAKKAEAAGAKIVAPPFEVMDAGRMAAVDDPTGAGVVLWQPRKHIGAGVTSVHGAIAWCELLSRDVDAAGKIWTSIFGWRTDPMTMPNGVVYTVFKVGDVASCGMMPMPSAVPAGVPSHWLPYFQVDDCDAIVKKTTDLGGRTLVPPMDAPSVGRFATLLDPQGAVFAILQPK